MSVWKILLTFIHQCFNNDVAIRKALFILSNNAIIHKASVFISHDAIIYKTLFVLIIDKIIHRASVVICNDAIIYME